MSDPEADTLRSTFPSYMAEGERLYLCGEFSKAAQSFSNVSWYLNLSPTVTHHRFRWLPAPGSCCCLQDPAVLVVPQGSQVS